ncbi:MAG: glycosyltransferase, partial [Thermoplasmata archaeon]|nr:glycosyltransferase [Thermoplasmata archaeon]
MSSSDGSDGTSESPEAVVDLPRDFDDADARHQFPSSRDATRTAEDRPEYVVPTGVSLVIPAYNEEDRLRPTLVSYLPALRSLGVPFEVIVSVSGEDNTWGIVEEFASQGVRGIRSKTRMGKGRAILEGFREAKLPIVALADADGSVPSHEVVRLIRMALETPQVVVASRRLDRSRVEVGEPWTKKIASDIWHAMVKVLLNLPVKDAECGFKVYTRELAQMAIRDIVVTNWVFDLDMLFHSQMYGVKITEVAVDYKYDMRSKMRLGRAIGPMFLTLWGVFLV